MKCAIVYFSKHHMNTKKLADAIAKEFDVTLIDAACESAQLSDFDLIGFASGIYYSKFHKKILAFAEKNLPVGKRVFFLYTYGVYKEGYTAAIRKIAESKSADIAGEYGCLGFNTFGPFKLIGGIAKGHPDADDTAKAAAFYRSLL